MADADRDALTTELISEGSRFRAALAVEQEAADADADPDAGTERHTDPQEREIARLLAKTDVADYFRPRCGRPHGGRRCGGTPQRDVGRYRPWQHDAVGRVPADAGRTSIPCRYSPPPTARRCRIMPAGLRRRLFPVGALDYYGRACARPSSMEPRAISSLVSAAVADARLPGVELDAVASTFTVKSLNPSRITAQG